MTKELSKKESYQRMKEWRNKKKQHAGVIERNKALREESKQQRKIIKEQGETIKSQAKEIEKLKLEIEELKQIIYGKKKKDDDDQGKEIVMKEKTEKKAKRKKESYQRKIPSKDEITETKHWKIENCPECEERLEKKQTVIHYEEDIPLPEANKPLKKVIQHRTEKGYCKKCRKWKAGYTIPNSKVIIGNKIQLYICYLNILIRLSYRQIQRILKDTYHYEISEGEIAKILQRKAMQLRPEFERIKQELQEQGQGVHMDETGWCHGNYLWVMTSIETDKTLYLANKTRGGGNIDNLIGKQFKGIRVTDCYAGYKNKPGQWQLCWAHPHRKLRDMAYAKSLEKDIRDHCHNAYEEFSIFYQNLREYLSEPYDQKIRNQQKQELKHVIQKWRKIDEKDPQKLKNIKIQFRKYEQEFLTCMNYDQVPCDNNKAERMLRHFVIKRKISFGNKSENGARALETLASVFMSYYHEYQDNFFTKIHSLCSSPV